MKAVTHLEKVIAGEVSAVTHLERVITEETAAVTYTEKVIAGTAPPITHLQKVIAGVASPVTHLEHVWAGKQPTPEEHEYTGAVPVTFVADGTPLLDYLISGNTVQTGTPAPDTPITPQGTGERTGNLAPPLTEWEDGYLNSNGNIADANPTRLEKASGFIEITNKETLAFSYPNGFPSPSQGDGWRAMCFYTADKTHITRTDPAENYGETPLVVNIPANAKYVRLSFRSFGQTDNAMLNTGSTPLPYEPYGYKIPISSANTTTPVYLGEVQTTRKVKKLVLSSSQNWKLQSINSHGIANFYVIITNDFLNISSLISNYFTRQTTSIADTTTEGMLISLSGNSATMYIRINSQTASTAQEFKDWLDGLSEEAAIWYVLAEPETGIVNEPLVKIGDYADTLSMEQAGVQIPTVNGSNTLDVLTTVKPSEVYVKYKG